MRKIQARTTELHTKDAPKGRQRQKPVPQNQWWPVQQSALAAYQQARSDANGLTSAALLALQRTVGNRLVQRIVARRTDSANGQLAHELAHVIQQSKELTRSIQRAPAVPDYTKPQTNVAGSGITRLEVHGLTFGTSKGYAPDKFTVKDKAGKETTYTSEERNKTKESASYMAVVLVPDALKLGQPVQVFLHFHGWGFRKGDPYAGYRVGQDKGGTVRDVDQEHLEQQIGAFVKGKVPQVVGILAQGVGMSDFGKIPTFEYIRDVLLKSNVPALVKLAKDEMYSVVLSAHSGGGSTQVVPTIGHGKAETADRSKLVAQKVGKDGRVVDKLQPVDLVVLFEALNGSNDVSSVMAWVNRQLSRLVPVLKNAISSSDAKALAELAATPKLRGYFGNRESGYTQRYKEVNDKICKSIAKQVPAAWQADVGDLFRIIAVEDPGGKRPVQHEEVISGIGPNPAAGTLGDALSASHNPAGDRAKALPCSAQEMPKLTKQPPKRETGKGLPPHRLQKKLARVGGAQEPTARVPITPAIVAMQTEPVAPSSVNVPVVASVEAIQRKIAELVKLKPKKDAYGEEDAADRATIITSIKEIRAAIAALNASDLGLSADQLKASKAQFYLQINKATPSYFQMENLDILWNLDKGRRNTAPGRTCNVTALSISLESLGISAKEFKGDKELLKLIWKYQQDQMSENSKKDEETAISKLKGKTKEKQASDLRAKGEKERTSLATFDLDGLRMPDFMQLIVIYNVLLKTGKVTGKMDGLGMDASTIKAMAAGQPDKFKETMDRAHSLARNSILFSDQFPDFAGWFGVKASPRRIKYSDQLDKIGAFGRARWKVQELQGQLSEIEQKADSAEGKAKARLEKTVKSLRSNIARRKSQIDYTITEQAQELTSLRAKAGRATGDEQATLTAEVDKLAAIIEARKGKQQKKITKLEAELEKLKGQQSEGVKGKTVVALGKKIKARQGQINELKSPTTIQSMDQFETMVPLKAYKDEVMEVFVPILSAGKHVEVNLHNHFVHLFEINDNGPVVDEVGEGVGKRLQLSWEKARTLGYFQSSIVYEK